MFINICIIFGIYYIRNVFAACKIQINIFWLFLRFRFGRVQSVKILKQKGGGDHHGLDACTNATVAFMDIKSANKAHSVAHKLEDRLLTTDYYDPSSSSNSNSSQHYNTNNSSSTIGSSGVGTGSNSTSSLNSRLHPEDGPGPGPGPGGGGGGSSSGVSASDLYNENHNSRSSHFVGDRLGGSGSNSVGGGSIRDRIGERGSNSGTSGSNMVGSDFFSSNSSNQNSSSHRNSNNERRYGQDEDFSRQRSVRSVGYRSNVGYNSDK